MKLIHVIAIGAGGAVLYYLFKKPETTTSSAGTGCCNFGNIDAIAVPQPSR